MILCGVDDIQENSSKGFELKNGDHVFAVKKNGKVSVYLNSCPHYSVPLEVKKDRFLDANKKYIQCFTHGALFEIETGLCVVGPCSGASLKAIGFKLEKGYIKLSQT